MTPEMESGAAVQGQLSWQEKAADRNLPAFQQNRQGALQTETHSAESSSRQHNLGAERELAAMVTNATLMPDSVCRSRASRSGKAILTPYSALVRLHLEQSVQFWVPCYKTLTGKNSAERIRMTRGLQHLTQEKSWDNSVQHGERRLIPVFNPIKP